MPSFLDSGILVIFDHAVEAIGIGLIAHTPSLSAGSSSEPLDSVQGTTLQVKLVLFR
jgi:hypothetical protein